MDYITRTMKTIKTARTTRTTRTKLGVYPDSFTIGTLLSIREGTSVLAPYRGRVVPGGQTTNQGRIEIKPNRFRRSGFAAIQELKETKGVYFVLEVGRVGVEFGLAGTGAYDVRRLV